MGAMTSIDLARQLHDTVAQRLAGLSYLLASDAPLSGDTLELCRTSVQAALDELRDALASIAVAGGDCHRVELDTERRVLSDTFPAADVRWRCDGLLEIERASLVESFLIEALRNVRKHAQPTEVTVDTAKREGVTMLRVANDGVGPMTGSSCGVGRHLLEVEASLHGALVQSGPDGAGRWMQCLILPNVLATAG
jgi:signal transduction histidine kinase